MEPVYEAAATAVINQSWVTEICCWAPDPQSVSHYWLKGGQRVAHIQFISAHHIHCAACPGEKCCKKNNKLAEGSCIIFSASVLFE